MTFLLGRTIFYGELLVSERVNKLHFGRSGKLSLPGFLHCFLLLPLPFDATRQLSQGGGPVASSGTSSIMSAGS